MSNIAVPPPVSSEISVCSFRAVGEGDSAVTPHPSTPPIPPTVLSVVITTSGITGAYCRNPATEVDHVEPVKAGGADALDNLVPSCRRCNRRKGI